MATKIEVQWGNKKMIVLKVKLKLNAIEVDRRNCCPWEC